MYTFGWVAFSVSLVLGKQEILVQKWRNSSTILNKQKRKSPKRANWSFHHFHLVLTKYVCVSYWMVVFLLFCQTQNFFTQTDSPWSQEHNGPIFNLSPPFLALHGHYEKESHQEWRLCSYVGMQGQHFLNESNAFEIA